MKPRSEKGVALVITLIMLSVITVMAVAFLALTRRERAAVANASEHTDAQDMARAAEEHVKAAIIADVMAQTNWTAGDLRVSRNLINTNGFIRGLSHPTNVNYDYLYGGGALSSDDLLQNLTNLWIDPRPPVFVNTNRAGSAGPLDFRFFVDLNRNGRFDTNGWFMPYDNFGQVIGTNMEFYVGDPEWIGVLERPNLPHSSSNRFFGRYAYMVLPIGKTLDLNFIHNDGKRMMGRGQGTDNGYYRNQGFGTWEINLAGFLAHLNVNEWPPDPQMPNGYDYSTNLNLFSRGFAFIDATDLLRFRYNLRNQNLYSARDLLPNVVWNGFRNDQIDAYVTAPNPGHGGPLTVDLDDETLPWPGACSTPTNHFFSIHDLFLSPSSMPPYAGFANRLMAASSRNNSYDQQTLTRLLSQLGTDSAPEPVWADIPNLIRKVSANDRREFPAEPIGRINLNWDNIQESPTDQPLTRHWDPLKFFTNTANVLLRSQFTFGATNIPIYPTNWYTPEVHRLLQLAANLTDATTNKWYPSVFQPEVTETSPGIWEITGFKHQEDVASVSQFLRVNTFGLPMIIGVKKGIPNFNEYVVQTHALAARKLELIRRDTNSLPYQTNQMFVLGVSNYFAVEAWNPYSNSVSSNLPVSDLTIIVGSVAGITITNSDGLFYQTNYAFNAITNLGAANWQGFECARVRGGFVMPLATNLALLTNSAYRVDPPRFELVGNNNFDRGKGFPVPEWQLTFSNRLTFILHDETGRILDFVYLDQITNTVDLTETLVGMNALANVGVPTAIGRCWMTNRVDPSRPTDYTVPTEGIIQQLRIASAEETISPTDWNAYNFGGTLVSDVLVEADGFRKFLGLPPMKYTNIANTNLVMQAPFNPSRKLVQTITWQANDPLVHHRVEHLKDVTNNISTIFIKPFFGPQIVKMNTNALNERYRPWIGNPNHNPGTHPNDLNHAVKDPGVICCGDWDFPTNKFPSIGWIGRVHRGTPWQSVYLKAEAADESSWAKQFLDLRSHPTNDWRLIDMFTVAPHPNATRGQLSINQTNIASWSAVLSGVFTLTNAPADSGAFNAGVRTNLVDTVIEPSSPAFLAIVDGINRTRANMPDGTFRRLGDILQVPELSIGQWRDPTGAIIPIWSPYLARDPESIKYGLTDVAYERIPQQILSLLRVGDPRYLVYAFGQSLKPADQSIVTSGGPPYFGMCTNYQITGEVVTRSVVRLEGPISRPRAVIETFNILPGD